MARSDFTKLYILHLVCIQAGETKYIVEEDADHEQKLTMQLSKNVLLTS